MPLAEIVYHNRQAFLKLPDFFPTHHNSAYVRQDPQTGDMIVSPRPTSDWGELWRQLEAIGEVEEIADIAREAADYQDPLAESGQP